MYKLLVIFFLAAVVCTQSACELTPEEPPVPPEYQNEQKPEDNAIITSESTLGNELNNSMFLFAEKSTTNNFYVVGSLNGDQSSTDVSVGGAESIGYYDAVLLKFDASGKKVWDVRPGFSIYRHLVIPKGVLGTMEYVLVTGYDENEQNPDDPDRNRIMLFDENGAFKSNLSYDFNLRLNSLLMVENTAEYIKVVVVGSVFKYAQNNYYPAYCTFYVRKSTLEIYDFTPVQIIDANWKNVLFENIAFSNGKYIISGYENDGIPFNEKYLGVHVSVHNNLDFQQFVWRKSVKNPTSGRQIYHLRRGMEVFDGKIYLTGFFEDAGKSKDSGGYYWSSPYVFCFSMNDGTKLFDKKYPVSIRGDKFYGLGVHNGQLYASGISSNSYCSTCSKEFTVGNAWICKIDPLTGSVLSQKFLGDPIFQTWISQFCIIQNTFWGIGQIGYTRQSSVGWVVGMNVNSI